MITSNTVIDLSGIEDKIAEATAEVKVTFSQQVLKDSNYFIPFDTGNLRDSSLIHSDFEAGLLVWETPYARRLYFNPQYNFHKDENPNASGLWYELARARFLSDWVRIVQREYDSKM